ncbi:MAG: Gfo/Idh/MocA family oxidoreductase [Eubacteriales bacterium]|nr:Gfo/Idh/MocA family oxidoreductase [Eubacteriales bacterium]
MNTAIIGMGNMGSKYARMILAGEVPGLKLTAVTRVNEERLKAIGDVWDENVKVYHSGEDLLAAFDRGEIELEALIVVTPHISHETFVKAGLKRGLHVLCDKPAGVYSRQAREMEEANVHGRVYGYVFHQRTYPAYAALKKLVDEQRYGKLLRVNWIVTDWFRPEAYYHSEPWRAKWSTDGGGTLLNQCPHNLDLLVWLCGMPESVYAWCNEGRYHSIEVEDDASIMMRWENGVTGIFVAATGERCGVNRLELSFEKAVIRCEDGRVRVLEEDPVQSDDMYAAIRCSWKEIDVSGADANAPADQAPAAYVRLLKAFSAACSKGTPLIADSSDARNNIMLINAMYMSSWTRSEVRLPKQDTPEELAFEQKYEELLKTKIESKS